MPSDFRQNGDNHEQLNIYYTSIIVKTGNKYNKFSKKTNQITLNFTTCTDKKTIFLHKKFALSKNIPTFAIPFRESSFKTSGNSSVGRARPCQGRGREFESRFPLQEASQKCGAFFVYTNELSILNVPMIGVLLSPIICAFIFGNWDDDKKK